MFSIILSLVCASKILLQNSTFKILKLWGRTDNLYFVLANLFSCKVLCTFNMLFIACILLWIRAGSSSNSSRIYIPSFWEKSFVWKEFGGWGPNLAGLLVRLSLLIIVYLFDLNCRILNRIQVSVIHIVYNKLYIKLQVWPQLEMQPPLQREFNNRKSVYHNNKSLAK